MNANPLISVLIPAYNHEKYVGDCVRSIIAQDYPRMELLIVDDGSSDGTWKEVQRLAEEARNSDKFERVEIATQENRGTCETLNRLLGMARGDVIADIASDDMYLPGAFSVLIKPLLEDDSVGLVVGQNVIMDSEGRQCYWDREQNICYELKDGHFETFNAFLESSTGVIANSECFGKYTTFLRSGNHIPNGYLIRRHFLNKVIPYRKDAPIEDFWLHLQLSKICKYCSIPVHTFRYRWHTTNTIKSSRAREMAQATWHWEFERILESGDKRWMETVREATRKEKVLFSLGRIIELRYVKEFDSKRRFLCIGKWRFMYSYKKTL